MFSLNTTARRWPLFFSKAMLYQQLGGSAERTVAKLGRAGQCDWDVILMDAG